MKYSGWDKMPRSEDAAVHSVWIHHDVSARRIFKSSSRGLSSRVESSKSSEASCRKEVSYARENKRHDSVDLGTETDCDARRSFGRSRSSFHSHVRGSDSWGASPDNHGNSYDTSGCCLSASFLQSGSRNAAAAAVAKVESNGFVVAPDGTIVKSGGMGTASHFSGLSSKSTTHVLPPPRRSPIKIDVAFGMSSGLNISREHSPERYYNVGQGRASRDGPGMVSLGHRSSYQTPMAGGRIDSPSLQHLLSHREQSFSPLRRIVYLSHQRTRSQSRSRTQPPHAWASPRGRNTSRINEVPNVRQQGRYSPNFKSQRRLLRHRSPQISVPGEELAGYAPLSRNNSSPPHDSRWIDRKRNVQDHLREHQHRCPTGSPPARILSRRNRLDHIDSYGSMKPDGYYQPLPSGRFNEYVGKGSRRDNFANNGDMKHLHYDHGSFRAHNPHQKSSGFRQRENLKAFDQGIDAQRGFSPRRIKEDMGQFRHGRDVNLNSDFKSFGVRDTSNDLALKRRPS